MLTLDAFTVVGPVYRGHNQAGEIPAMWQNVYLPRMDEIRHVIDGDESWGVFGNHQPDGSLTYMAGSRVEKAEDIPEGMQAWELKAQTYAVFPCTLAQIGKTLAYIHQEWLPASGYLHAAAPELEYYGKAFLEAPDGVGQIELLIPVVPHDQT